jgi:hypothetical protein
MKKAKTLKRNHMERYSKRRLTKKKYIKKRLTKKKFTKKKFTKKKYTKKIQRGGVCPCAVPLSASAASYVATALGGLGIYSLSKKKRKKPKK